MKKVMVKVPFAFKCLKSLVFMFILPEDASSIKELFSTLEVRARFSNFLFKKSNLF